MPICKLEDQMRQAASEGRTALIPFLPAGFPDLDRFWTELTGLDAGGADIIEIGVPFSDPVADGPVVEEASLECLERGINLKWIMDGLRTHRAGIKAAVVLMGYYNPFLQYGLDKLAQDAAAAGVDGLIVPDLPAEEAGPLKSALAAADVALIPLVGLNTSAERMKLYADYRGFVYYVSVLGTTGARDTLPAELKAGIEQARAAFTLPLALGFGLKSKDQLGALQGLVDGAVFGSALIRHIRGGGDAVGFMSGWK